MTDTASLHSRVLLIRHGQTEWSLSGKHTGRTDIDLTSRGESDAAALNGLTDSLGLDHPSVLSSPRTRARRTAELAGLQVDETDELFGEWDYGDYEGLTSPQIHADLDPDWTIFSHGAPHGESVAQMTERVDTAVHRVRERLASSDVVVVSHGHFSRSFICRFVGWPIGDGVGIDMHAAGWALLRDNDPAPRLSALHGPADEINPPTPTTPQRS